MPLIIWREIRRLAERREAGLENTIRSMGKVTEAGVVIEHVALFAALGEHPRLLVQPARVVVPSAGIPKRGLGDMFEVAAKPVAKVLGLPCLDAQGRLKPDSGCAKRRDALNAAGRAVGRVFNPSFWRP